MAFESAGKRVGSMAVNLIRLVIALLILTLTGTIFRGVPLPVDASIHAWIWLSISGLVGFTVGDLCLFRAFVVLGSRISVLLMALVPPFAALLGWAVIGEQLSSQDLLGMALTLGGVTWVVLERKSDLSGNAQRLPRTGILLGIGGAFGQALGLVLSKYGMDDYHPIAANQIRVIAGIGGFSILFVTIGWWPNVTRALSNTRALASTSIGAFFGPFLGVTLSLISVKYTQIGVAATLMALVPVLIIPPAILIQKESISLRAVLGATLAVGGAALLFLG